MKDWVYINYYSPNSKQPVSNKLLVIGFLRKFFKFNLFFYYKL